MRDERYALIGWTMEEMLMFVLALTGLLGLSQINCLQMPITNPSELCSKG